MFTPSRYTTCTLGHAAQIWIKCNGGVVYTTAQTFDKEKATCAQSMRRYGEPVRHSAMYRREFNLEVALQDSRSPSGNRHFAYVLSTRCKRDGMHTSRRETVLPSRSTIPLRVDVTHGETLRHEARNA